MSQYGPQIMALVPSFIVGFVAGRFARKTLRKTLIIGGLGLAALAGLGFVSLDLQTVTGWVQSGSAWADENLEGATSYLAALLPSATAAAAGGAFGFRGGRDREGRGKERAGDALKDGVKDRVRKR
jgi:uncharacterized membrane protein (Fun14 family)